MTAPIGPGDWLLCVRADGAGGASISVGSMYQMRRWETIVNEPCPFCGDDGPALELEEITVRNWGWCHCCFAPAGRGGMFNSLLTAKPIRVGEDA